MLADDVELVSVNDHLVEPAKLWTERSSTRDAEAVPHVVSAGGDEAWALGDYRLRVEDMAGLRHGVEMERRAQRVDEMHPAVSEPAARLEAMDLDGVEAQLVWPNAIGFAGERL